MENRESTIYNKTDEFDKKILPLLQEARAICRELEIPFFYVAAVKNTDKHTSCTRGGVMPQSMGVNLTESEFENHLLVSNGFLVENPAREKISSVAVHEYSADIQDEIEDLY